MHAGGGRRSPRRAPGRGCAVLTWPAGPGSPPRPARPLSLPGSRRAVPLLGRLLRGGGAYRYLSESLRAYPAPARVAELMNEVGLTDVRWRGLPSGMAP